MNRLLIRRHGSLVHYFSWNHTLLQFCIGLKFWSPMLAEILCYYIYGSVQMEEVVTPFNIRKKPHLCYHMLKYSYSTLHKILVILCNCVASLWQWFERVVTLASTDAFSLLSSHCGGKARVENTERTVAPSNAVRSLFWRPTLTSQQQQQSAWLQNKAGLEIKLKN